MCHEKRAALVQKRAGWECGEMRLAAAVRP